MDVFNSVYRIPLVSFLFFFPWQNPIWKRSTRPRLVSLLSFISFISRRLYFLSPHLLRYSAFDFSSTTARLLFRWQPSVSKFKARVLWYKSLDSQSFYSVSSAGNSHQRKLAWKSLESCSSILNSSLIYTTHYRSNM